MTNIQQRSILLIIQIIAHNYFVVEFNEALKSQDMAVVGIQEGLYDDQQLIMMWNEMWLALPDDASCRRQPFFELCDLCEEMFNEPDEVD